MNFDRRPYVVVTELPADIRMTFGKNGAPEQQHLRPVLKHLGEEKAIAALPDCELRGKEVVVRLPESLACHGEGRYELWLHDRWCRACDRVEIWFEADCEVVSVEVGRC